MSGRVRELLETFRQASEAAEVLASLPMSAYQSLAESRGVDLDDVMIALMRDGDVGAVVRMAPVIPRVDVPPSSAPPVASRSIRWGVRMTDDRSPDDLVGALAERFGDVQLAAYMSLAVSRGIAPLDVIRAAVDDCLDMVVALPKVDG